MLHHSHPRRPLAIAAVLFALALFAGSGSAGAAPPAPGPVPFGPGELCRFAVKFGFVRAGDATLGVEGPVPNEREPHVRFVSTAHSSRFFTTFFKVEDRVESVWSLTRRVPLAFRKDIEEGKYEKHVSIRFDHADGLAIYADGDTVAFDPGSQDVLSAFYYVRTQPLTPGSVIEVPNHADKKNYPLEVRVLRRERIEVPAGTFSCVVVEPLLKSAGLFKQEGNLTIWITDDVRRIPVLMKSKVAVGAISAELESYRPGRPLPAVAPAPLRDEAGR